MRRGAGCTNHYARWLPLLAFAACSRTAARLPPHLTPEPCEIVDTREDPAGAILIIRAPLAQRNDCALRLVAGALRSWAAGSLEPWTIAVASATLPDTIHATVTARRLRAAQARDALDADTVLVATEDLELIEYARSRDDLTVVALPWDRLHLRVGAGSGDSLGAVDPAAVGTEARRAEPLPECDVLSPPPQTRETARSSRAVYLRGDHTGRELAERLVGLGHAREVIGLDSAAFDAALSAGADEAYIVSVRLTDDVCGVLSAVRERAPWAHRAWITSLLETRAYGITRRGSAP